MISNPKVSVLMPIYNGQQYVRASINSILSQTFNDFEFIIVNDCSMDNSLEIIKSFSDPRIVLFSNKAHKGVAGSLNKGLALAKGEYIARQDADDISLPERLQKQFSYLESHPDVGVLGTGVQFINEYDEATNQWIPPKDNNLIVWSQFFSSALAHPSVMFRREIILQAGGYRLTETEDFELWSRLVGKTRFSNLQEILVLYRRHSESKTIKFPKVHKDHTLAVLKNSLSRLLNRTTEEDTIQCLDKATQGVPFNDEKDLIQSVNLIMEMEKAFQVNYPSSYMERGLINRDIGQRLAQIAEKNINLYPRQSREIMFRAIVRWPRMLFSRRLLRFCIHKPF